MNALNRWLDQLPRTRFGRMGREWPAYKAMGVAGFYAALLVMFAGGLMAGRSLLVLAGMAAVCGLSFFVYAWARRRVTGREKIVLLEHVWFALMAAALFLYIVREPILPYLDVAAPALTVFLLAGRIGCTLVGCCHGNPARLGLKYGEAHVNDGFPTHLIGVRLFPVAALEGIGLMAIAIFGFAALPWARPGVVLAWFLLGYGVLRFAMEGLRGDNRPHWLGISAPRWMCMAQAAAVLCWTGRGTPWGQQVAIGGFLAAVVAGAVLAQHRGSARRAYLNDRHTGEIRTMLQERLAGPPPPAHSPFAATSSRGVSVALSAGGRRDWAHVSLALGPETSDVAVLCELAARALDRMDAAGCRYTAARVLHIPVPLHAGLAAAVSGKQLYGQVVRRLQQEAEHPPDEAEATPPWLGPRRERPWYFRIGN